MRILIATGGSPHSDKAVRLGGAIASVVGTGPTVLTVVKSQANVPEARRRLEHALTLLPETGEDPDTQIRFGDAAAQILAEAEVGEYQLIVVGERSQHRLLSRLLSPTSERVIAQARCPVLVAKSVVEDFNRILVCDSGANDESLLERFTAQFSRLLTPQTEVTVLHVMSQIGAAPGVRGWQLRADAESLIDAHTPEGERLEHNLELLEQSQAHSEPKVRHGRVVDEILAESECDEYDLIVIGAHRAHGWQRLLLDDIAHQVIRAAERPVLVMRGREAGIR
ncbi:MAG TPA: universal stress protein [Candidatus Sulfomarinibacteraceae bacterium]|nr:universal stress protein [Candidatus Sulfomarinibacteraceae bacterium]